MFGTAPLGFGASQEVASQLSQSTEKRPRQEDKQVCLPVTCRLLSDATAKQVDAGTDEIFIHGNEVVNVALVGVIEGLVQQATMLEFILNDATGRIKVRHYQSSESGAGLADPRLIAGRYVSVVGTLRTSPAIHISALSLRPIEHADEVSYHMVEVAHAGLTIKRGGSRAPATAERPATQVAVTTTPTPARAAVAPTDATPSSEKKPVNLRDAVLEALKREGDSRPEGVPLSLLFEQFKASSASEVRASLEQLISDGEVFATIDDEHFQAI